jgi:hypothetical protein
MFLLADDFENHMVIGIECIHDELLQKIFCHGPALGGMKVTKIVSCIFKLAFNFRIPGISPQFHLWRPLSTAIMAFNATKNSKIGCKNKKSINTII